MSRATPPTAPPQLVRAAHSRGRLDDGHEPTWEVAVADNLTRKLLTTHLRRGSLQPGNDVTLAVDQVLIEDATGGMGCMQFEALGVDRVAVDPAVLYVDHNVLQIDERNMTEHHYLRSFCHRYGVRYSRQETGSPTTCTWSGSPDRARCWWVPTRTPRWQVRSACSRSGRAAWRWPSRWPGTVSTSGAPGWYRWSSPAHCPPGSRPRT